MSLRLWPRSLFGRLSLILLFGLVLAHALSFGLLIHERSQASRAMMILYLAKDVASSVAILERVPAGERPAWLGKLARRNYRYLLGETPAGAPDRSELAQAALAAISGSLGPRHAVTASAGPGAGTHFHLRLADGAPLAIELSAPSLPLSPWVSLILSLQLALLVFFSWLALRLATRPLAELARAADALGPDGRGAPLRIDGPLEVARAAAAFNAMQRRIAEYVAERIRILANVSHDLQSPLTRMRLRVELMDDAVQRDKLAGDLNAMLALVAEGIAYARGADGVTEAPCRIDLDALLDSLICDYADAGKPVRLTGRIGRPLDTRPHTLRRIVSNLVDNALKFAEDPEVFVAPEPGGRVTIAVRDRGPGIAPGELTAVLQPFYRVEGSRNRETGGTGLGLAIAHQLAVALNGTLVLANRDGGGLEARLSLPS